MSDCCIVPGTECTTVRGAVDVCVVVADGSIQSTQSDRSRPTPQINEVYQTVPTPMPRAARVVSVVYSRSTDGLLTPCEVGSCAVNRRREPAYKVDSDSLVLAS